MPMFNAIEYSKNYLKTSGSFWQYYRDHPNDNILEPESFKRDMIRTCSHSNPRLN